MHVELEGTVKAATAGAALPGPAGRRCVLVSSWEASRSFPRTRAGVIAFDLAADDGRTHRIDPSQAAARVAVRLREGSGGGHRETGYIELGERITVEGRLDDSRPGLVLATLIVQADERPCGVAPHRLPPGALTVTTPEDIPVPAPSPSSQQLFVAEPPQTTETPPPEIEPGVEPPRAPIEPERAPRRKRR